MIVHRIPFNEDRFHAVRYQSGRAVARSLPGAHPVLAVALRFRTNVREAVAQDLPVAALTLDVSDLRLGNNAILDGLSEGWLGRFAVFV